MSLKAFHIVFIGISILLAAGFGVWIFLNRPAGIEAVDFFFTLLSFSFAGGLILYGIRFLRKFKHISTL